MNQKHVYLPLIDFITNHSSCVILNESETCLSPFNILFITNHSSCVILNESETCLSPFNKLYY